MFIKSVEFCYRYKVNFNDNHLLEGHAKIGLQNVLKNYKCVGISNRLACNITRCNLKILDNTSNTSIYSTEKLVNSTWGNK